VNAKHFAHWADQHLWEGQHGIYMFTLFQAC